MATTVCAYSGAASVPIRIQTGETCSGLKSVTFTEQVGGSIHKALWRCCSPVLGNLAQSLD